MKDVLEYIDYQKYLNDWIQFRPRKGRGIKLDMANYLGITPAQVSKVLNQATHLTLAQAAKLITYLGLSDIEGKYFLSLVELERAGGPELREIIQERLDEQKSKWESIEKTVLKTVDFSTDDMDTYFSSYQYNAIETITNMENFQTASAISRHFNISKKKTLEILSFLVRLGILEKKGDKFIHIGSQKWHQLPTKIKKINAINWRNRAIASIDYDEEINIHRDMCFTIDAKTIELIEKDLTGFMVGIVDKYFSQEEEVDHDDEKLCSICLDFFEIK